METLLDLQNRIYQQNVAMGWHDKPRSFNTFVCLFHSELSEGVEGLRKGLMDDHLVMYPMVVVEVADFVIRVLDWFGSQEDVSTLNSHIYSTTVLTMENIDYLAEMHQSVSAAMYFYDSEGGLDIVEEYLNEAISMAFSMANANGWDLVKIMNEKMVYNQNRADHKRENREKVGGKKW